MTPTGATEPTSELKPVAPVTWNLSIKLAETERAAWAAFFYNVRDGIVDTKLTEEQRAVFVNRASELYDTLIAGEVYPG